MKLITKEIEKRFEKYPLYSQDGKGKEAVVVVKLFLCIGYWTWYILEANLQENIAFGIVINGHGEAEYAYIDLKELQRLKTRNGLTIERDLYFIEKPIKEIEYVNLKKFLDRI